LSSSRRAWHHLHQHGLRGCAKDLMLAFLDESVRPLDTQCVAATDVIDFYVD
jgi:hypothetical protein